MVMDLIRAAHDKNSQGSAKRRQPSVQTTYSSSSGTGRNSFKRFTCTGAGREFRAVKHLEKARVTRLALKSWTPDKDKDKKGPPRGDPQNIAAVTAHGRNPNLRQA